VAENFINFAVTTDAQELLDRFVSRLQEKWPDWTPNDADLESIMAEALAPMAQDAAETAARVPAGIFRSYGSKILNNPYRVGIAAETSVTITLTDPDGHTIPARTEIEIDGYAFATETDVIVPPGALSAEGVTVVAVEPGEASNNLPGDVVSMISALAFVESVVLESLTSGGQDAEDDIDYQDRLSRDLELQATTLVTARDYELMGLQDPGVGSIVARNDGERNVLVVAVDEEGEALPQPIKDRLIERYEDYRLVNTVITVADPTYTTVNITYEVAAYTGFDEADLITRINQSLEDWLQPGIWGRPKNFGDPGTGGFAPDNVVRKNRVIDIIGDNEGVAYVVGDPVITGAGATIETNGDLTMPGDVALTRPGDVDGVVA
jgi:hypothetical protein